MFKPIKDFITFIQKNTSTNGSEGELDEESSTMDNIEPDEKIVSIEENLLNTQNKIKETNTEITKSCLITTNNVVIASDFDEDDIELQIKSSIMLKNPSLKSSTPSPTPTTTSSVSYVRSSPCTSVTLSTVSSKSYSADHNQNLPKNPHHISPEDDDELADFKNDPLISLAYDDFHSLNSESEEPQINSADDIVDEIRTEEEDTLDDISQPPDEAVKREIFVVIDNDLNSSIASSSADDPLAIDISTLPTSGDEAANPLDSSTNEENDEVSSISGLNWLEGEEKPTTINSTATLPSIEFERISNTVAIQQPQQSSENLANISESISTSRSEEMERCDNSDSGLGTETSSLLLQTTLNNSISENSTYRERNQLTSTSVIDGSLTAAPASSSSAILPEIPSSSLKPLRSNLKRQYCDEADVGSSSLPEKQNTKDQVFYPSKKPKRSINFDTVQVYYFPRQQGFGCVPSAGGCTLGMGTQHIDLKRLTLAEHAAELRRAHRLQLQEVNPRGSSSEETDESEEDYLSEGSGSDLDADSNGFLQPVPPKQRRAILKAAGVRKIDTSEKVECRNIRNSREICGCTCRDFCDPETCSCSRAGIKCQVDRAMFPCGCSRDACGNTTGRVEFNPARVRTHFIHTIMRLDMENRQQQQPMTLNGTRSGCGYDSSAPLSSVQSHTMTGSESISNHNVYYNMQTQSNYSSGYASPAYPNEHNANYYQQQPVTYANTADGTTNAETPYHSLDSVDGSVFASNATNTVPSYGEIIPNYCPNNSTGTLEFNTTGYHPAMTYTPTYLSYQHNQNHDTNSSYLTTSQHSSSNNSNNSIVDSVEISFSSCSVPSRQPYGIATTCNSSTTKDSNFISLSTPITSSSRLSQINDLLQHNRNTTAALVAVSQHSEDSHPITANSCANNDSILNSSIEIPTFNENHKDSLAFGSNLARAPLTTVSENPQESSPHNKSPEIAITLTPPIEYDSRVAVADYTI